MRTTVNLDDALLDKATVLTGVTERGSLIAALSSGGAACPSGVMVLSEVAVLAPHDGIRW